MANNLGALGEAMNYNVAKSTELAIEYHKHKEESVKLVQQTQKIAEANSIIPEWVRKWAQTFMILLVV